MSFRVRKSVKLGPGVRLTASKRSASLRVGPRGAGVSASTSGRRTTSVGVPGSGVYWTKSAGASSRASASSSRRTAAPPVAPPPLPKAGLFAPAHEKAFAKGVSLLVAGRLEEALAKFEEASRRDTAEKALADDLFAGLLAAQLDRHQVAMPYLEKVVRATQALPDSLMAKYIPGGVTQIQVTPSVVVEVEFGSMAAALGLAEIYQRGGRREEAIAVLQQLDEISSAPALTLSLAELLSEAKAYEEVVQLTAGVRNEDDLTLQLCIYQAEALQAQGMTDAALEVYREALRARKRDPELLKAARYGRGKIYIEGNRKAQGRKDLGRVYADDPGYRDVAELLKAHS